MPGALAVAGDVRDQARARAPCRPHGRRRGRLDIVVNNAGGPPPGTFERTPDRGLGRGVRAVAELGGAPDARLALPHLKQSGRGRIVNITSWSVREPIPNLMLSNAIRPGVVGWAKTLAHELGPEGITVNTIAPGKIDTPRVRELWSHYPDPEAAAKRDIEAVPARRLGAPARSARWSRSCARRPAAYISGTVLPVDGGVLRGIW